MKIEIAVVDFEGQLWFELDKVKFDTLNASWELDREDLQVVRNGDIIARAGVHEARGEPIFDDYGTSRDLRLCGAALHAEDFALHDRLVLEVPDGLDLVSDLKKYCGFLEIIATMPVGEEMSLDEMRNRMTSELTGMQQATAEAQVLRFRRGK
jgi:hypothetical protein